MTQIKEGLFKSRPYTYAEQTMVEDSNLSRDLKPSQELLETIATAKVQLTRAKDLIAKAYQLAIRDGFSPLEARQFLTAQLPFLAERTIRQALPAEAKNQSKDHSDVPRQSVPRNPEPDPPNIVNITTKAEIRDAELTEGMTGEPPDPEPEEDPKDTEIQFLKEQIAELQEALKKTDQFQPASDLQPKEIVLIDPFNQDEIFEWLGKRDNGVNCYWYPNYGIELFRNRILTQLKNKGVTTFKRLYFEV